MSKSMPMVKRALLALLPVLIGTGAAAQAAVSPCDEAWVAYNAFKARNVMEPSQYPLTLQGAAVREACGKDALPVPPGSDVAPLYRVHKPRVPPKPPEKPKPVTPPAPQLPALPKNN